MDDPSAPLADISSSEVPAPPDARLADAVAVVSSRRAPIVVRGPAWVEYHLLLGDAAPNGITRIEREVRAVAGAPFAAILLARWRREVEGESCGEVELHLDLGHDPNARLLRRELEKFAQVLPLRVSIEEEGATEVPYRILMWPREASTGGGEASQVLQRGEIVEGCVIADETGRRTQLQQDAVSQAAAKWAWRAEIPQAVAAAGARRAWRELDLEAKLALGLSWGAVAQAAQEEAGKRGQIA